MNNTKTNAMVETTLVKAYAVYAEGSMVDSFANKQDAVNKANWLCCKGVEYDDIFIDTVDWCVKQETQEDGSISCTVFDDEFMVDEIDHFELSKEDLTLHSVKDLIHDYISSNL